MANRIQSGPHVALLAFGRSVILPGDARSLQFVGAGLEIETGKLIGQVAIVIQNLHRRVRGGVTSPSNVITSHATRRIVDRATGLRSHGIQMIRKAGAGQRRKHVIGKNNILRVGPIVRDVGLVKLSKSKKIAVLVRPMDQIELVHIFSVHAGERIEPSMFYIARQSVRSMTKRYDLTSGDFGGGGAVGSGKRPKIMVEGAILFDDENDMLKHVDILRARLGVG